MTYDTVRRLMPVTFRAVSLRRADEETTPGVHCFNEIAVKDKPSYGNIDFAARCGSSQLFEPHRGLRDDTFAISAIALLRLLGAAP